ncbi:MAG: glutamate racemase [Oscillospiraceae bacterium]|nr:glutamate racemase [Oscillospiraceae bacterium]
MMSDAAIGVFDSGLGGLTCVKQLISLMPNENIIYFGDTARVPYGNRSIKTISRYAAQAIDFLLGKQVKLLINACGSMSSSLDDEYTKTLPVAYIGCVEPAALAAVKASRNKRIGVIATAATISSRSFEQAIVRLDSEVKITTKACPLLVPLVENGYISADNTVTRQVASDYLLPVAAQGVDSLVLGCTHYPIIGQLISDIVGNDITLIDSGAEAAKAAGLKLGDMRNEATTKGSLTVYISDNPFGFSEIAERFLGFMPDNIEQVDIEIIEKAGI